MKQTTKTENVVDQIMAVDQPCNSCQSMNMPYFSKKYLDLLELRELEYNIHDYDYK